MVKVNLPLLYAQQQSILPLVHNISSQQGLNYAAMQQQAAQALEQERNKVDKSQSVRKNKLSPEEEKKEKNAEEEKDANENATPSTYNPLSGNFLNIKT